MTAAHAEMAALAAAVSATAMTAQTAAPASGACPVPCARMPARLLSEVVTARIYTCSHSISNTAGLWLVPGGVRNPLRCQLLSAASAVTLVPVSAAVMLLA